MLTSRRRRFHYFDRRRHVKWGARFLGILNSGYCLFMHVSTARDANFFSYDIFVHGSKFQFIDGINLNLTHVCVCCKIIFVFTYIAFVVFVYKVNKQKSFNKNITQNATNGFRTHAV